MYVSKHFIMRQKERGITDKEIVAAVTTGHRMVNRTDANKYTFVDNNTGVYVVTDKGMTTLITTFRKG